MNNQNINALNYSQEVVNAVETSTGNVTLTEQETKEAVGFLRLLRQSASTVSYTEVALGSLEVTQTLTTDPRNGLSLAMGLSTIAVGAFSFISSRMRQSRLERIGAYPGGKKLSEDQTTEAVEAIQYLRKTAIGNTTIMFAGGVTEILIGTAHGSESLPIFGTGLLCLGIGLACLYEGFRRRTFVEQVEDYQNARRNP